MASVKSIRRRTRCCVCFAPGQTRGRRHQQDGSQAFIANEHGAGQRRRSWPMERWPSRFKVGDEPEGITVTPDGKQVGDLGRCRCRLCHRPGDARSAEVDRGGCTSAVHLLPPDGSRAYISRRERSQPDGHRLRPRSACSRRSIWEPACGRWDRRWRPTASCCTSRLAAARW